MASMVIRVTLDQDVASAGRHCAEKASLTFADWTGRAIEQHGDQVSRNDVQLLLCLALAGTKVRVRVSSPTEIDIWRHPWGLARSRFVCLCCLMAVRHEAKAPPAALAGYAPFMRTFLRYKLHEEIAAAAGIELLAAERALSRWLLGTGAGNLEDLTILSKWLDGGR